MRKQNSSQELIESKIKDYKTVFNKMELIFSRIKEIWSDFEPSKYESVQVNNYLVEAVTLPDGKKVNKRLAIVNHNDNPLDSKDVHAGDYHFDCPIYIIGIQGSGTLSCGGTQQGSMYDKTQEIEFILTILERLSCDALMCG